MHLIRSVSITTEKFEFCRNKGTWGKSHFACCKWKEWLDNSKLNDFSENSIGRLILILPWWHCSYYNFFDIWRLIYMRPQPLCCSKDNQKYEWKMSVYMAISLRLTLNLKPLSKIVLFTWWFHCRSFLIKVKMIVKQRCRW